MSCNKLTKLKNTEYHSYIGRKWTTSALVVCVLFFMILISISVGAARIPISEIVQVLTGGGEASSRTIIFNIRMPRIATGVVVGFALAMAGCIMQNVLRNPLASASTLGIAQGASFGAAIAIVYFQAGVQVGTATALTISVTNPYMVTLFAFLGGITSTIIILLLSRVGGVTPTSMILAGVALSAMFTGGTALIQYFADETSIASIVYWTFGNLGRAGWNEITLVCVLNIAAFLYFFFNRWNYNAMESGTHTAKSLGVNANALILISMLIATLISAVAIAFVGTINFIGLIAPHIVRKLVGNDYRFLIPCSAIMGATIMLAADIMSRTLAVPAVLPIGAITSFLGAPLFLYLIIKKGKTIS